MAQGFKINFGDVLPLYHILTPLIKVFFFSVRKIHFRHQP